MKFWNRFGVTVAFAFGFFMGVVLTSVFGNSISLALADHRDPDIFVHFCVKRSGEAKIADSFDECEPNDNAIALTSDDGYNELSVAVLAEQAAREEAIAELQLSQRSLAAEVAQLKQALVDEQVARREADSNIQETLHLDIDSVITENNNDKKFILNKLEAIEEIQKALREYLNAIRNVCIEELDICPFQGLPPL